MPSARVRSSVCCRRWVNCLDIGVVGPALKLQLVEIARQVQWKSNQSNVHLGGGVTHKLKDISGITALLCALIADILGERKLAGGCTVEDIYVTEVFVLRYECMAALKEYHWDAKGNTYGNLLIRTN